MTAAYVDLIGIPFRWGGRGPDAYDCFGLLIEMNRRWWGVEVPDHATFKKLSEVELAMARGRQKLWRPVPELGPGVSVQFRIKGHAAHVGFMLDDDWFLHTWEVSGGVLAERLSRDGWEDRLYRKHPDDSGGFRYVG
jgi:cell wall-associated NlpC family hydrolase